MEIKGLEDPRIPGMIGARATERLQEEVELISGVYPPFDEAAYQRGEQSPVFFGSALNNFGVKELLDVFVRIAPHPQPKKAEERLVLPEEKNFSGFVFKIHANMDPKHRDRLAFVKVVSGVFERNKAYQHVRLGKDLKFSSPTAFMASRKSILDEAFPGDIVGLHDTGNFRIGDSLTGGEKLHFKGIPSFSPEHFRFINNDDPMKAKQLAKGIDQLMDEGVAQLFTLETNGRKIIGTVGALQYEVIQYRLEHEYNAKCSYEPYSAYKACWIVSHDAAQLEDFRKLKQRYMVRDKYDRLVFLADSAFSLQMAKDKYDQLEFRMKSDD